MTKIDRNWKVIEEKKASGVDFPEWFLRVLGNRGIAQKSQLEDYLNPKYENIADFENFTDIKKASTRIKDAKEKNETICVYGDYDVDGITATALVYESLSKIGIQNIKTYIPHRENEGYGLNKEAVSELKKEGVNLIITVDCGIVSSDIIDTEKEIDFIVIDHHKIDKEKQSAINFIDEIIRTEGFNKNFFIVSSKAVRNAYLDNFIEQYRTQYPDLKIVPTHYGNLRGINEAKECDIGIMLGSHIPSDAVEIAMALELFNENMKTDTIITTINNLWTWKESKSVRVYKDEYEIIEQMANAIQFTEHRQAIARTRYLFHDVDFYILSKKAVNSYDPYFPEAETLQYRADLFPPRQRRSDNKRDEVEDAVRDWLSKNEIVYARKIEENYGIGSKTVSNYLKEMADEGLIEIVEGKKYRYKLPAS